MDLSLRPATREALHAFRTRYNALLWSRAGLLWVTLSLALLLLIAVLDWAALLSEEARPWATLLAYLGCLVAAWRGALRFLRSSADSRGSARLAESAAPELHEKLLAAIELAESDPSSVKDSLEFRARLQDDVATAVQGLDWRRRLPSKSLSAWRWRLAVVLALAVGLAFIPRLHLPGFLARAALPFANLERPSGLRISIDAPSPASGVAPIASEVPLAASIMGDDADRAYVEFGEATASVRRMELGKISPGHFEGRLPIGQEDVRYRVRAADGMTAWHVMSARARPRITEFVKTIVPPDYVGGTPVTAKNEQGDIEALAGSKVKLSLQASQALQEASIVLNPELPEHPAAPKVSMDSDGVVQAELPLDGKADSWTVRLKGKETGFTNDEAAAWRITLVPDLPPLVQINKPQESQLSLLADESLTVGGSASDDVGLKSIHLAHAVNGEDWKEIDLPIKPGKEASAEHLLALAPLQVKTGDTVLVKLVATDLKGQKAESSLLRIIVLEQTVDPAQRTWAAEMRRVAEMAKSLEDKSREMVKAMSAVQKVARQEKKGKPVTDEAHAQLARAHQQVERVTEQADDLWEQLKKTAQSAPTRLAAEEVRLLGDRLAQMRREPLKNLANNTADGVENPDTVKRDASIANSNASLVEQAAKVFAADETARITHQSTQQTARQQALLTDTSLTSNRDQSQRPKWQEQQRAALAANEQLKEELAALKEQVPGGQQKNLDLMQKEITEAANDLKESLDKPAVQEPGKEPQPAQTKSPEHLYGASDNLRQRLARSTDAIRGIAEEAARKAAELRQRLQTQDNPALATLSQARVEMTTAAALAKDPKRRDKQQMRDGLTHQEHARQQLEQAARQLQDQGELREQNPLTNTAAALDANRASRAADKLAQDIAEADAKDDPKGMEQARDNVIGLLKATRLLDADELIQNASGSLAETADSVPSEHERNHLAASSEAAQQAAEQLKQLPIALRRAETTPDLPNTAQQAADQARVAAQQLQDQARQEAQRQPNQPPQPAQPPPALAEAQSRAQQVAAALAPKVDAARQQLAGLAPKVSDMMKQVAGRLDDTRQKTDDARNDADAQKPVADVAKKAQDIQPDAAENAEKMQRLQAALRQEANAAELAKADQRQLARTADVALEQMRQKTPEIAQNLKQAARAAESKPQAEALQRASQAQQKTADALRQLAENFSKMEQGQEVPQEALAQLEEMEKDLGVQEPLKEAYDKAEKLADVSQDAQNDPQKALSELERQLSKSPAMQKALADIARDTAQKSREQLGQKANQPAMLGMAAEDAGHELERVARHEQRLGKTEASKQVRQASGKLNATAKATKTEPGNATPQVTQETTAAAQSASTAAADAAAATPAQPGISAFEQTQAMSLAQALDQLDAQLHPATGAPQPGQQQQGQGQQQQAQQGQQGQPQQQGAQQSLAQAQKSQQQSMAQARAEGKVPGQSQAGSQQQAAQNQSQKGQTPENSQAAQGGGNFAKTPAKEGALVPINVVVDGNWGKLPARMAEDLTEATRQEAAPEYRAAIENYYKAIAAKAKK